MANSRAYLVQSSLSETQVHLRVHATNLIKAYPLYYIVYRTNYIHGLPFHYVVFIIGGSNTCTLTLSRNFKVVKYKLFN